MQCRHAGAVGQPSYPWQANWLIVLVALGTKCSSLQVIQCVSSSSELFNDCGAANEKGAAANNVTMASIRSM